MQVFWKIFVKTSKTSLLDMFLWSPDHIKNTFLNKTFSTNILRWAPGVPPSNSIPSGSQSWHHHPHQSRRVLTRLVILSPVSFLDRSSFDGIWTTDWKRPAAWPKGYQLGQSLVPWPPTHRPFWNHQWTRGWSLCKAPLHPLLAIRDYWPSPTSVH